jgi:hypothetical protein
MEQEAICWQCGKRLRELPVRVNPEASDSTPSATDEKKSERKQFWQRSKPPLRPTAPHEAPITFTGMFADQEDGPEVAELDPPEQKTRPEPKTRTVTTLTGEEVEVPADAPVALPPGESAPVAATIGAAEVTAEPEAPVFVLTFCKVCGYQNPEGVKECVKCKSMLEVVHEPLGDVVPLPRAWGFDALGVLWIVLGIGAIFSGWFLLKADPSHPGQSWADYFWTGVVACAPGILIFMRHVFCKILFWVMTLGSILVWAVIGTVWVLGHLYVTDNGQVGLTWLFILSVLSAISYYTVRVNDAFDYSL